MSEADALLDAIWANPSDDTPRLVYADWLEEHGYEDYGRYIRLSCRLEREILHPADRARLRLERFLLGQEIVKANPRAFPRSGRLYWDALPSVWHSVATEEFLSNWPHWWPFLRPRSLELLAMTGREAEVARCDYLPRLDTLECEGVVSSGWGHRREDANWDPVSGTFLAHLAGNDRLDRLVALKVEPIRATAADLLAFASSSLASRLDELRLWVQWSDGSHQDLRAEKGFLKEQITDFVAEHVGRFASPPS